MKNYINYSNLKILVLFFLITLIFFLKNPLNHWLEGDIENSYFIYNTLLTANSITPTEIDYPGNSSFSINSIYLKFISAFDKNIEIEFSNILNSNNPLSNLNKIYFYLKILQLFYFLITFLFLYKIFIYISSNDNISYLLTLLFLFSLPLVDNIQRYRFDFESFGFYIFSTIFLIFAIKLNKKKIFITISGFFLCISIFSKILVLPLFLIFPIMIYFTHKKKIRIFLKNFFFNKELIILFFLLNCTTLVISIYSKLNPVILFLNIFLHLIFYFFYSELFKYIKINKKNLYFFLFLTGMLLSIFFMYSQSVDIQKIFIVTFPLIIFDHHFSVTTDSNNFFQNIISSITTMRLNFFEFTVISAIIFLIVKNRNNFLINFYLILIYLLYKLILSSKGGEYLDIFPYFILIFLIALNIKTSKNIYIIYFLIIFNLVINFNNLVSFNLNDKINDELFCITSNYTKKEFENLKGNENFILYYLPKFADQKFLKKLC